MLELLSRRDSQDSAADVIYIARMLLVMACVPPRPDSDDICDQYEITSFNVSSEKIEITNHGITHVLKVREHT